MSPPSNSGAWKRYNRHHAHRSLSIISTAESAGASILSSGNVQQVWWDMKLQLPTTSGSLLATSRRPAAGSRCSCLLACRLTCLLAEMIIWSSFRELSVLRFVCVEKGGREGERGRNGRRLGYNKGGREEEREGECHSVKRYFVLCFMRFMLILLLFCDVYQTRL